MKKKLFQYTVLVHQFSKPTKSSSSTSESSLTAPEYLDTVIAIQPTYLLAKSEKEVIFKITREIPAEHAVDPDNVEILIRNF